MVAVTAQVDDPNRAALKPGAFAQVSVPIGSAPNAPVIPQTAIRPSERGFLAYVVEGNVAKERVLNLGMRTADGRVEVKTGLKPGEMLVVRGVEALRDGAPVRVAGQQQSPEQMKVRPAG
jgi:multidrug efflux system membrane fusion protein